MAAGEIRIFAPGTATAPYPPPLILSGFNEGGDSYSRSQLGWATGDERSNRGTTQIAGPAYDTYYRWNLAYLESASVGRHLLAFAKWQDREYKAGRDGRLRLRDEVLELESEPPPHSRTLITPIEEEWPDVTPWVYGFGIFDIKLEIPEAARSGRGVFRDHAGTKAELILFSAVEVQ